MWANQFYCKKHAKAFSLNVLRHAFNSYQETPDIDLLYGSMYSSYGCNAIQKANRLNTLGNLTISWAEGDNQGCYCKKSLSRIHPRMRFTDDIPNHLSKDFQSSD